MLSLHFQDQVIARKRMVEEQLIRRNISDPRVLEAMAKIPRHIFVEEALKDQAYGDFPLGIGHGQTISQPYTVALMSQGLHLVGGEKILEIGTGCGYQTSVLAELGCHVHTIERIKPLAMKARGHLKQLGYRKIVLRVGDGTKGWPEAAPFDGILIAAGAPILPESLLSQLKMGGKLVVPVGSEDIQNLLRITVTPQGAIQENLGSCRFVRLVGQHGWSRQRQAGEKFKRRSIL